MSEIKRLRINSEEYQSLYATSNDIRRVGEWAYLMTLEQWDDIPFINEVPIYNPSTHCPDVEFIDDGVALKRKWIINPVPPIEE